MSIIQKSLFFFSLLLIGSSLQAQNVEVLNWDQFEARLNEPNDTLHVFNFWATWCKPCVEELPSFEKVHQEYADQPVKVVLVSLDFASNLEKGVKKFMRKEKIQSEVVLLDAPKANEWIPKIDPEWSGAIPVTVITRPGSDLYEFKAQQFTYEQLSAWVDSLL